MELATVLALLLMILVFSGFKRFDAPITVHWKESKPIDVVPVPRTSQSLHTRAPERPAVPIASEDAELPADATIATSEFHYDMSTVLPPPEFNQEQVTDGPFVPYDEPPKIIGGYAELARKLVYPELARKAGISGIVVVNVLIGRDGQILATKVIKSLGNNGCDEAAVRAIMSVKWTPAYQRDKPVRVWVGISIAFILK